MANQLADTDAVAACPDNVCSGIAADGSFVEFYAFAGGANGYYRPGDVAGAYEYNGQLLTAHGWQQLIDTIVESQREKIVEKIAAMNCSSDDSDCVSEIDKNITLNKAIGHQGNIGGNYNFDIGSLSIDLSGCVNVGGPRCGTIYSLHFAHPGAVHLDTANPVKLWGLGGILHLAVDVIGGNTIFRDGIPR